MVPDTDDRLWVTGANLAGDATAVRLTRALEAAGVRPIVLKGLSTRRWSQRGEPQHYSLDVDLLVEPAKRETAERVLRDLGYESIPEADHAGQLRPTHAIVWNHPSRMQVDLHETLVGVTVPPPEAWTILTGACERIDVAGGALRVFAAPAQALHIVLHAAQHGVADPRTVGALDSAAREIPLEIWNEAADLARRLGAMPAFAAGLDLVESAKVVRENLAVSAQPTVSIELRRRSAPQFAHALEWMATRPGVRAKIDFAVGRLLPPRAWMRLQLPDGKRGNARLAAAYVARPFRIAIGIAPASAAWLRARRAAARSRVD